MKNKTIARKTSIILVLSLLITMVAVQIAQATSNNVVRLKNGMRVLIVEDTRFPLVSTRLFVQAGSAYEEPEVAGLSHLLEHMVFKGTEKRKQGDIAKELEQSGAYLNASTSFDVTIYINDLPAKEWKLGMDTVADMAFHPLLDPVLLEQEKEVVIAEMNQRRDNPDIRLYENLQELTLKSTPYAHSIAGTEESVRNITVEKMRDYRTKHYNPMGMLLVVVGNIDKAEVLAEAERVFGGYQNNEYFAMPAMIDSSTQPLGFQSKIEEGQWNKVRLAMALPVPSGPDVRSIPLDILAMLLGGTDSALLPRTLKYEKQLVDNVDTYNSSFERVGLFAFSAQLDPENLSAFWKEFSQILANVNADSFTEQEIERAKLLYETSYQRSKETLPSMAGVLGNTEFFQSGELSETNTLNAIRNVDKKQIQEAIDTWFSPDRLVLTVLLPQGSVDKKIVPDFEKEMKEVWKKTTQVKAETEIQGEQAQEVIELATGSKVIFMKDDTIPFMYAQLAFSGGHKLTSSSIQGLSTALAGLITEGTKLKSKIAIEEFLLDRASSISTGAGRESFNFSVSAPTRFEDDVINLLSEIITMPAFSETEWERVKKDLIANIVNAEESPSSLLMRNLMPFLFTGNAYGFFPNGTVETIEKFNVSQIEGLWTRQKQQPWVLTVVGDFDKEKMLAFANTLPKVAAPYPLLEAPVYNSAKTLDLKLPDRNQAHILQIFPAVSQEHPDAPALALLTDYLSGMSGLLFQELREKENLAYSVTAMNPTYPSIGFFAFYISTDASNLDKVSSSFANVVNKLQEDILDEETMKGTKTHLQSAYIMNRQMLAERGQEAVVNVLFNRSLDYEQAFLDKINKVTAEEVQQVAKKYFNSDSSYLLRVLP